MSAQFRFTLAGLLLGVLAHWHGAAAGADNKKPAAAKPATVVAEAKSGVEVKDAEPEAPALLPGEEKSGAKKDAPKAEAAKPRKTLNPALVALRDRVRKTLARVRQQPFDTQQNNCTEILYLCQAFGCSTEVNDSAATRQKVNGITCLCWNMTCAGYEPMTSAEGHLTARIGYGYQDHPSQLAAVLALAHVPVEYPARSGETVRTVADLVEYEKLTCRAGSDMSLKLVALANYATGASWKNNLGEEYTLERVVAEELARPVGTLPHSATNRLLGISCALARFNNEKKPVEGELLRAKQYVDESIEYAYRSQNTDGSWGKAAGRDYPTAISFTGHMLQWLMVALPARRLEDPEIVRGIDFLDGMLSSQRYQQTYLAQMTTREIAAAMQGVRALVEYDERVFAPCDPPAEEAAPAKAAAKTARNGLSAR